MGKVTGTPKKVTLDGRTFDVMGDSNFSQIKGKYTNESVPTSGANVNKKTARAQNVESVNLQCSSEEADFLKGLNDRITAFPMSYELVDGSVFRATGFINFENHDTENGTAAVVLQPERDFVPFFG